MRSFVRFLREKGFEDTLYFVNNGLWICGSKNLLAVCGDDGRIEFVEWEPDYGAFMAPVFDGEVIVIGTVHVATGLHSTELAALALEKGVKKYLNTSDSGANVLEKCLREALNEVLLPAVVTALIELESKHVKPATQCPLE